jgi:hypothetical protein
MLISTPDNFRYIHHIIDGDPIIAIAMHDNLHWAVVSYKWSTHGYYRSKYGHETEEAALQDLAQSMAIDVWKKTKESQSRTCQVGRLQFEI